MLNLTHKNKLVYETVNYARRFLSARAVLASGFARETSTPSDFDGIHLNTCPFPTVIRKFSKATGKRETLVVPCGKCMWCRHRQQNKLIYRMYNHNRIYRNALFVTLTYNDAHYTSDPVELRRDITLFIKRFRKELGDKTLSYYMVCERGDERNRCHFHMLIWWNGFTPKSDVVNLIRAKWYGPVRHLKDIFTLSDDTIDLLSMQIPRSSNGFIFVEDTVNTNIASYVSKYVSDIGKKLLFRSWSIGLGMDILALDDDLVSKMRYLNIIAYTPADHTYHIPVSEYYKGKVFSQSERDAMFLDYLNSDQYAKLWEFYNDEDKRSMLLEAFHKYEERTLANYAAKRAEKRKRKRLL